MFLSNSSKIIVTEFFFDSIILLRFNKTKAAKEKFYGAKKPTKIWHVNVDNIVVSKLAETENNS